MGGYSLGFDWNWFRSMLVCSLKDFNLAASLPSTYSASICAVFLYCWSKMTCTNLLVVFLEFEWDMFWYEWTMNLLITLFRTFVSIILKVDLIGVWRFQFAQHIRPKLDHVLWILLLWNLGTRVWILIPWKVLSSVGGFSIWFFDVWTRYPSYLSLCTYKTNVALYRSVCVFRRY